MIQKTLYTGNGVSLSPMYAEGRTESKYVRLIADDEKAITNGVTVTTCVDVLKAYVGNWTDCELPLEEETDEATEADYQNALREMGVEV